MIHPDYKQNPRILDYTGKIGLNGKGTWISDPKRDMRLGQNTVSTVAPLCTFLRIENRAKTKKTRILFEKLDFREKT